MKPRDAALVAAVVVLAALAAADALRDEGPSTSSAEVEEPRPAEDAANPGGRETFARIDARGSLLFTEGSECRLREVSMSGTESPVPRVDSGCRFWASPAGPRIAYALPPSEREPVSFRFLDLNQPERDFGTYEAAFGSVAWSPDGQRAAWCDGEGAGFELDLVDGLRRVAGCPRGYTPAGEPVTSDGFRLLAGGRVILESRRHIAHFSFGVDGSVALLIEGGMLERRVPGEADVRRLQLPPGPSGLPVTSRDNCHAAFLRSDGVYVVDLCIGTKLHSFAGRAAAWSPDGSVIAVAQDDAVAFYRVTDGRVLARWPVTARALVWRG